METQQYDTLTELLAQDFKPSSCTLVAPLPALQCQEEQEKLAEEVDAWVQTQLDKEPKLGCELSRELYPDGSAWLVFQFFLLN